MAAGIFGNEYTVTASAVTLTTALGLSERIFFSNLIILANENNSGNVYLGRSNVTTSANRLVVLKPDDSFAIGLDGAFCSSDDWYIIGPGTSEIVHIVGIV